MLRRTFSMRFERLCFRALAVGSNLGCQGSLSCSDTSGPRTQPAGWTNLSELRMRSILPEPELFVKVLDIGHLGFTAM